MDTSKGKILQENLLRNNLENIERHIIVSALRRTNGNQVEAARQLGTTKRIIALRVQKYKIDISEFRKKRDGAAKMKKQSGERCHERI